MRTGKITGRICIRYPNTQFFGNHSGIDAKMLALAGKAADGYMGCKYTRELDENTPETAKVRELLLKYHGRLDDLGSISVGSWVGAMLLSEGLKRDGRHLTRDGLIAALETVRNFDPDGLMPSITWGPMLREGGKGVRIVKGDVEKKVLVPVSDWIVPTD